MNPHRVSCAVRILMERGLLSAAFSDIHVQAQTLGMRMGDLPRDQAGGA